MIAALLEQILGLVTGRPRSLVVVDVIVVAFLVLLTIVVPYSWMKFVSGPVLDVPLDRATLTIRTPPYDRSLAVLFESAVKVISIRPIPAPEAVRPHFVNQTVNELVIPNFGMSQLHNIEVQFENAKIVSIRGLRRDGAPVELSPPPVLNSGANVRARPSVTASVARALTWGMLLLGDVAIVLMSGVLFMLVVRVATTAVGVLRGSYGDPASRQRAAERAIEYATVLSIMAPTLGFFLTALGLVSALARTLDAESVDLGFFYSSVSLAMVSTALGLLIRLGSQVLILMESTVCARLQLGGRA